MLKDHTVYFHFVDFKDRTMYFHNEFLIICVLK